jgi:hypothetical protein
VIDGENASGRSSAAGVRLAFAELRGRLQELILRYGLMETLDRDHFCPTLEAALSAIESAARPSGSRPESRGVLGPIR